MALSTEYDRSVESSDVETAVAAQISSAILFGGWVHVRVLSVESNPNARNNQYNSTRSKIIYLIKV